MRRLSGPLAVAWLARLRARTRLPASAHLPLGGPFWLLWTAVTVSSFGDGMRFVALPHQVVSYGAAPLGAAGAGLLAHGYGLRTPFLAGAAVLAAAGSRAGGRCAPRRGDNRPPAAARAELGAASQARRPALSRPPVPVHLTREMRGET
jgi:hypothetical protein